MKNKLKLATLTLLSGLICSLAVPMPMQAITSDDTDNKTLDNIKKVIQEKKVELSTGAATMRRNQAYLAEVVRINEGALTVQTHEGQEVIPLEEVAVERDGKEVEIGQLSIGSWVGVFKETLGENKQETEQKIERVVAYERDFSPSQRRVLIGSIESIGRSDLSFLPRGSEEVVKINIGRNSTLQDSSGETVKLNQFYEDLQCLIVTTQDETGNYTISTMRALSVLD